MSALAGVPVTVHASANAPVGRAFHVVAPIDLPRIFRGFGPLPAVVATREQAGAWDHVGATRVVWTYTFRPASAAARPLVWAVVAPLWRAYARRALALAVIAIERD